MPPSVDLPANEPSGPCLAAARLRIPAATARSAIARRPYRPSVMRQWSHTLRDSSDSARRCAALPGPRSGRMVVVVRLAWLVLLALPLLAAGCASGTKAGGKEQPHAVVLTIANHDGGDRDLSDYIAAVKRLSGRSIRLVLMDNWRSGDADYDRGTLGDVRAGKVARATA